MPISRANWPGNLPLPQIASAGYSVPENHDYYETVDGASVVSAVWRRPSVPYGIEVLLVEFEPFIFESFYHVDLIQGMSWFTVNLAVGGEIKPCVAHFMAGYELNQLTQFGVNPLAYRMTAEIECKHRDVAIRPWL